MAIAWVWLVAFAGQRAAPFSWPQLLGLFVASSEEFDEVSCHCAMRPDLPLAERHLARLPKARQWVSEGRMFPPPVKAGKWGFTSPGG